MKKSTITLIVAAALIAAAVPLAYAAKEQGDVHRLGSHFGMRPLARLARLKAELNLTDEQAARIREIAFSVRSENALDREQVKSNLHQIAALLIVDPGATAEAQAILTEQIAAEQRLKANALEGVSEALRVLTPEQRARLASLLAKHHSSI